MNKYKVCVYAICKNEEKHVKRWVNSVKEADEIYVLDTGSTDNTINLLKSFNVNVKEMVINPWRFDIARNESLHMVPEDADICVTTDLDEVLCKGWRKKLEQKWNKDTNLAKFTLNWAFDENNKPIITYHHVRTHDRKNYYWKYPVHEVIMSKQSKENVIICDNIFVNHYPDKNKSREQYLDLLKLAVEEYPDIDRNYHYLGREYMYWGMWNEAIDSLIKHIYLPSSTWKEERSTSMRYIARCYSNLSRYDEANMWALKAITETPHRRCPYVEKAFIDYKLENYQNIIYYLEEALKLPKIADGYVNESFSYNETIYDLLAIAYFNQKNYKKSLENIENALKIKPNDERLINNKKIILSYQK